MPSGSYLDYHGLATFKEKLDAIFDTKANSSAVHNVPSGGTSGQVLKKVSGTDYDVAWGNESGGGGGGGTTDYTDLSNKPQINGVTLAGNKSLSDIGAAAASAIPDVSVKADKVSGATVGHFASLDAYGNLTDSGHKHSDYLTSHQDISGKIDKPSNPATGAFLVYNGTAWVAQSLSTWQGGNY